jgi:hypothetical protein
MDFPPFGKELFLLVTNHLHSPAQIVRLHTLCPDKSRSPVWTDQVDLGLPVSKDVDMSRLVVVRENDDAQPIGSVDRDHTHTLTQRDGFFKSGREIDQPAGLRGHKPPFLNYQTISMVRPSLC